MERTEIFQTVHRGKRKQRVLYFLYQPLTAKQISKHAGFSPQSCEKAFRELANLGLVTCLNAGARRSRLYWLTEAGEQCQIDVSKRTKLIPLRKEFPRIPWPIYGKVLYSHRIEVVKALNRPQRPATLKRTALCNNPFLRMSARNCLEVLHVLMKEGIVSRSKRKPSFMFYYELTELGSKVRELLVKAEIGPRT